MNENKKIIEDATEYIKELFKDNSDGHDFDHTMRVYNNAITISKSYENVDLFLVSLASLLHDADDYKIFNTENNENARKFMKSQNLDNLVIDKICTIINEVSFSKNKDKTPSSLEGMIVQDADRLDAMGAIGIARCFAYGAKMNRDFHTSLKHFDEKLLLLKDKMNTKVAKEMARERHEYMIQFLKEFNKELGE